MVNLLQEVIECLKKHGKTEDQVLCVGIEGVFYTSWTQFKQAANFDYYNGYGRVRINACLVIKGSDWWLERAEYDGAEWWEFKQTPMFDPALFKKNITADDLKENEG